MISFGDELNFDTNSYNNSFYIFDEYENNVNPIFQEETLLNNDLYKKEENLFDLDKIIKYNGNTDSQTNNYNNKLLYLEEFSLENDKKMNLNNNEIHYLNHKVKKEKDEIFENKKIMDKEFKQKNNISNFNNPKDSNGINLEEKEEKQKVKYGRKKKNDTTEGQHNKYSEDNIINKLKGEFFNNFIRDFIQKHSENNKIYLKKLPREFISDLSKQNNERLWKMKISDILQNQTISTKYKTFDKYENRKIINKIYKENKEIKLIKILELTFEELFIIFRRKLNDPKDKKKLEEIKDKIEGIDLDENYNEYEDIEDLINGIKKKYKNKKNEIGEEYIKKLKNICLRYNNWFNMKIGRNSQKFNY